jgi:hypothetical protein
MSFKSRFVALVILTAPFGACGGAGSDVSQSPLVGTWHASPAPGVQAAGFIASSSIDVVVKEDAHYSTALEIHYLDNSPIRSACTETEYAEGGTWSINTISGTSVIVLAGTQTTTVERMGCKQSADNQPRTPDANGFKIGGGNVPYQLSGDMLVLHFNNADVTLQRQ